MANGTGRYAGRKVSLQVIFLSHNGKDGAAQDYCREPAPESMEMEDAVVWARNMCCTLQRREGCEFSYRIEQW